MESALQLPVPQGILFTTPSPSAGLELLEAALQSGVVQPCPAPLQAAVSPGSSVLATVDSSGSVLLTSSLNSSFSSGRLSPSPGVLLSKLVAESANSAWACPLILLDSSDDTGRRVGAHAFRDPCSCQSHDSLTHCSATWLGPKPRPSKDQQRAPELVAKGPCFRWQPTQSTPVSPVCPVAAAPFRGFKVGQCLAGVGGSRGSQAWRPGQSGPSTNGVHDECTSITWPLLA